MIWVGYRNSIIYAITGSFLSVSLTMTAGYVFTRNRMPGRKFFLALYTIPMFFNGGLIPTYLVVQGMNLVDNPLVLILLGAVSMYKAIPHRKVGAILPEEI